MPGTRQAVLVGRPARVVRSIRVAGRPGQWEIPRGLAGPQSKQGLRSAGVPVVTCLSNVPSSAMDGPSGTLYGPDSGAATTATSDWTC
jgi:hypothetical protein